MSDANAKLTCEYCNHEFMNKFILGTHQKRAKYCLKIQKEKSEIIVEELMECEFCLLKTDINKIQRHYDSCKIKLQYHIKQKDELIEQLRQENTSLRAENKIYKKLHEDNQKELHKLASRPTNTTVTKSTKKTKTNIQNTTNIVSGLNFDDAAYFKEKIDSKYDKNYLKAGHYGVIDFTTKHILTDSNGYKMYICTDLDNKVFTYKNHDGVDVEDPKAEKLFGVIRKPIKEKAIDLIDPRKYKYTEKEYDEIIEGYKEAVCFTDNDKRTLLDKYADILYCKPLVDSDDE